jgi:hypothetical protein
MESVGGISLLDVSRAGRALLSRATNWTEIRARGRGASEEAELPAGEYSFLADLSDDGREILGTDVGQSGGPNFSFYVQRTDGSAPLWLGEGDGQALSPDGRFALVILVHSKPQQLVIVSTGAGQTRTLAPGPIVGYSRAVWHPTGRAVVIAGIDASDQVRLYDQDLEGGPPRPFTAEGVTLAKVGRPVSPDARRVVAMGPDGVPALYPLQGGEPQPLAGLNELDVPIAWTPDGREILVVRYEDDPPRIERIEVASGRARPWHGFGRSLPSARLGDARLLVTPDGKSYAYGYYRAMSSLHLSSPLR